MESNATVQPSLMIPSPTATSGFRSAAIPISSIVHLFSFSLLLQLLEKQKGLSETNSTNSSHNNN
jgi:hypothetical protein